MSLVLSVYDLCDAQNKPYVTVITVCVPKHCALTYFIDNLPKESYL